MEGEGEGGTKATTEKVQDFFGGETREMGEGGKGGAAGGGGGVLHAIGETIVEIGQTTKELLVGQDPPPSTTHHQTVKQDESVQKERKDQ